MTAGQALGTRHTLITADQPYATYLLDTLAATGEPPNHAQTAYFGWLARVMAEQGMTAGLCGEGADSLFGVDLADDLINARWIKPLVPRSWLRRVGAVLASGLGWEWPARALRLAEHLDDETHPAHPINAIARFTDLDAVEACFGANDTARAAAARRGLVDQYQVAPNALDRLHAVGFLGEAVESASLWTTLFQRAGVDLLCPFLDSRMVRFAINLPPEVRYQPGQPKHLLKRALANHLPRSLVERRKLGFGQPIFEWLGRSGSLRPLLERMEPHDFLDPPALGRSLAQPNWFLSSVLCYDLWHKLFIERSLPRPTLSTAPAEAAVAESPVM
jgi:asparagine synthase (glutamine-hydrolysing)